MRQSANSAPELAAVPGSGYRRRMAPIAYALSVLALALGLSLVWHDMRENERGMRRDFINEARLMAAAIQPEELKKLQGNAEDLALPQYQRLKKQIESLQRSQDEFRHIYLVGHRHHGEIFFFLGNAAVGAADYVAPGESYADASAEFRLAVNSGKELFRGPLSDRWGCWVTAIVPINDPGSGRHVAALGIDCSAARWQGHIRKQALPGIGAIVAIWLFAIAGISSIHYRYLQNPRQADLAPTPISAFIVILGIMITSYACWRSYDKEKHERADSFLRMAENQSSSVVKKFHGIAATELAGLAHFFASRADFSKSEFDTYVGYLRNKAPVSLWGWIEPVMADEREAFVARAKERGVDNLSIWEPGPNREIVPAQGRDRFFPVLFHATENKQDRIIGADLGSESIRLRAIRHAIQSRLPAATGSIGLGFNERSKGMIIFHPVFAPEAPGELRGIAFAIISFSLLVNCEFRRSDMQHLSLHILNNDDIPELLCECGRDQDCRARRVFSRPLFAFGQVFLINSHPNVDFFRAHPCRRAFGVFLVGLLLALALALIVNLLLKRRAKLFADVHAHSSALSEARLIFNQLAEQSRTVQWRCTPEGRYSEVNTVVKQVFGYSPEQLVDKMSLFDLSPRDDRPAFDRVMRPVLQKAEPFIDIIKAVQTASGARIKVSSSGIPILDEDGQLQGFYGWDRDVTDREELAEKLLHSQRSAEAASQAKSRFITNISHEIRTPINGIIGFADLMRDSPLHDEQREYIDVIGSSSRQLLGLVNELLDYAQLDAGDTKIAHYDFDLRATIEDLCCQVAVSAHQKKLELLCIVPPQLPLLLHGDELHLQQAILCLLDNAIKFTQVGEVAVAVSLDQEDDKQVLMRFTVSDTGIGISPELRQHIFESFFQADESIKRRHGGAGLGLSIAKHLVEQMGGSLSIDNAATGGSIFSFAVPLAKQGDGRLPLPPAAAELSRAVVLVIDDHAGTSDYLQSCLAHKGFQPQGCDNFTEALRMLQQAQAAQHPYQVVFLDLGMPGLDKYSAAALSEAAGEQAILIGTLPLGERNSNAARLRQQYSNIITKPFRQKDLWHCLRTAAHNAAFTTKASQATQAPAELLASQAAAEPPNAPQDSKEPARRGSAKILLVEDHPVNQRVALLILAKAGYSADLASNGLEALQLLARKSYQLVLMDVQMPEMDGFEATRRIRDRSFPATNREVPIIAITAHAIQGYRESCLAAGMNDFLTKPYTAQQLRELIEQWLRH